MTDLGDLDVLLSISNGFCELAGNPEGLEAIDAECELWQERGDMKPGGMVDAAGSLPELRRRLAVMARRPELTDRQRAIVSILQGESPTCC